MRHLTIDQEIDLYMEMAQCVVKLTEWYNAVDPHNKARIQEVTLLLREALDSRVEKFKRGTGVRL